jgi:hypothetical protein
MEGDELVGRLRDQLQDFYQAIYEIPKIIVPARRNKLLHLDISELKEYLVSKSKKNMEGILQVLI